MRHQERPGGGDLEDEGTGVGGPSKGWLSFEDVWRWSKRVSVISRAKARYYISPESNRSFTRGERIELLSDVDDINQPGSCNPASNSEGGRVLSLGRFRQRGRVQPTNSLPKRAYPKESFSLCQALSSNLSKAHRSRPAPLELPINPTTSEKSGTASVTWIWTPS